MDSVKIKRIVVKLGTNSVMSDNRFNSNLIDGLAKEVSAMVRQGKQFILVSSGAIGLGLEKMHLNNSSLSIEIQQAMAAIGQSKLMYEYENAFEKYNQVIAQVLLTQHNFENKESILNLQNTLEKLLSLNIVPIVNENDAIAIEELAFKKQFSDNDLLATKLARNINADLLVMVSNVGGLFSENPENNNKAVLIGKISDLNQVRAKISGKSLLGKGGFKTKLQAAEIALKSNIPLIITKGKNGFLAKIIKGNIEGTLFEK